MIGTTRSYLTNLLRPPMRRSSSSSLGAKLTFCLCAQLATMQAAKLALAADSDSTKVQDLLAAAEKAYQQVDFATTYETSCQALERGHADAQQTKRLNVLCGIAAAALDKRDEARAQFTVALALQPDLRLERDLSPKLRSPYLEAQGFWSDTSDRLSLRATRQESSKKLLMKVVDPAHLAATVKVYLRAAGTSHFRFSQMDASPSIAVPLTSQQLSEGYDYYAIIVDSHDNSLFELGTESEPIETRLLPTRSSVAASRDYGLDAPGHTGSRGRPVVLPVTMVAVGLAAVGAGVYFNVRRENAAHTWNSSACEQPGPTRLEQCGSVNTDRVNAERAAIGFYAAGGALVAGGLTILAIGGNANTSSDHAASAKGSLACGAWFPFAAVACEGRF